ncbi:hypothetical protein ACHAWF_008561 [Thalassiosira exigua]
MFDAPVLNPYGATYYGTAAVSQALGGGNWLASACDKCWRVTRTGNVSGHPKDGVATTVVLKGANYCPPENSACSGSKAHFDIGAPGFDVTQWSFSHTCPEREAAEDEGFSACEFWQSSNGDGPYNKCDCSKFSDEVLRAGCENFLSLGWNNVNMMYTEVACPVELSRLSCWENNGNGYLSGMPELCASNVESRVTPTTATTTGATTAGSTSSTLETSTGMVVCRDITDKRTCSKAPNCEGSGKGKNWSCVSASASG